MSSLDINANTASAPPQYSEEWRNELEQLPEVHGALHIRTVKFSILGLAC